MNTPLDKTDARLLSILQAEFPLVEKPYHHIADQLAVEPDEAIERIGRLKADGVIREISAIFNSSSLSYRSALVAFKVTGDHLDSVGEAVAAHNGVSHCYSRNADYNLWFTITLPPDVDLENAIRRLAGEPGVEGHLILPALRLFKIGVFLSMEGETASPVILSAAKNPAEIPRGARNDKGATLTDEDRAAVRALQRDLPLVERPFAELADEFGLDEGALLDRARSLLERGVMRRYAAVLRHTRAGYRVNAMVCWKVPPERVEQVGSKLAQHPAVSHCYERPAYPEWPWPLYTMVHCRTEADLDRIIGELAELAGRSDYRILRSLKEYRKTRVRYLV